MLTYTWLLVQAAAAASATPASVSTQVSPVIQVSVPTWISLAVVSALLSVGVTWGVLTTRLTSVMERVAKMENEYKTLATRSEMDGLGTRLVQSIDAIRDDIRELRRHLMKEAA